MRQEYPRPSFVRDRWLNLNGEWQIEFAEEGKEDCIRYDSYMKKINVPFCIESELSGIGYKDFVDHVFYRRNITVGAEELNGRVILHFGAVDNRAIVYVNKKRVGEHIGGYASFAFDITGFLNVGENVLDVEVFDYTRSIAVPSGKQSPLKNSFGCMYTRTTGIWQTVWLEYVNKRYISSAKITSYIDDKLIIISGRAVSDTIVTVGAKVSFDGECKGSVSTTLKDGEYEIKITLDDIKLWGVGEPNLYDIELTLYDEDNIYDRALTYTAFREFKVKGRSFYLNGERIFLKQVLDQGYYEKGIYTAPSIEDIHNDIDMAIALGFNGARLHQKVFEEEYLYYADKRGFLVWGEYPNWGCRFTSLNKKGRDNMIKEWLEVVERDYNHPCIIGWCPLNEAWSITPQRCDYVSQKLIFDKTKEIDPDRVFIGASGGDLYVGDVYDIHTYVHDTAKLKEQIQNVRGGFPSSVSQVINKILFRKVINKDEAMKMPCYLSEYGGISYMSGDESWGYNKEIMSEEEYIKLFKELTGMAFRCGVAGICYTQLYDVEQEKNGLIKYDRTHKLSEEGKKKIKEFLDGCKY